MGIRILSLCCALVLLEAVASSDDAPEVDPAVAALVEANNAFACRLYQAVVRKPSNLILSPLSMAVPLRMAQAGATGETLAEMDEVLGTGSEEHALHKAFPSLRAALARSMKESGDLLYLKSAMWIEKGYPIRDDYQNDMLEYYGVRLRPIEFRHQPEQAVEEVNEWARAATQGRVKRMLDQAPPEGLLIANAVFFQGTWTTPFEVKNTWPRVFYARGTQEVRVPTMFDERGLQVVFGEEVQVVELPYRKHQLSMVILLPTARDGLEQIEAKLNPAQLKAWRQGARFETVKLYLPKFKGIGDHDLAPALKSLGIEQAFSKQEADFWAMVDRNEVVACHIGEVRQRAGVEVTEEGTVAWATSYLTVPILVSAIPPEPIVIRVDHPFLYLIEDTATGSILFMGRVVDPR